MPDLATNAQNYVHETLGVPTSGSGPWSVQESLPYFLRDAFDFHQLDLLGLKVLLALEQNPDKPAIGDIRNRVDKLRAVTGLPVIYVTAALASYERKRLIEHKVPFIVPGNQLYLPDLGLDLREHFRQRPGSADAPLSPSAQAILITALLRPRWETDWYPAETAANLGYTAMTLSRAVRELTAAGLAQTHKAGRTQYLSMAAPREVWTKALPLLRNPVQRTVWTLTTTGTELPTRVAGLSALARLSMLAEPKLPVLAVSRSRWQALMPGMVEMPEAMPGACEWQLWNYAPTLQSVSDMVDPLSLILSFQGNTDERVQSALDSLDEQLPW